MMIDSSKGNKGISQGGIKGNSLGNNIVDISQHNIIHNNNIITEKIIEKINDEVDKTELNIMDPKRRRMNEYFIHDTETNEEQAGDNSMEVNEISKNLIEAGAVQQPRLGL